MSSIRTILEENGWVRSIIAVSLVATWIATVFLRIELNEQGEAFVFMAIAFYLARPNQASGN